MNARRTDLALEAHALFRAAQKATPSTASRSPSGRAAAAP